MMNTKTAEEIPLEAKGALEMPEKDKKLKKKKEDEKEPVETNGQEAQEADEAAKEVQQEKIEELNKKIAELEKEVEKQKDLFQRTAAEYDNYRKRTAREMGALSQDIKAETLKELLPIADNIERAIAVQEAREQDIRRGVEMVANQISAAFSRLGVEAIEATGVEFDPTIHNAVMHVEDEEAKENQVVEMFQKGYKIGDKILRHAMVKVAN